MSTSEGMYCEWLFTSESCLSPSYEWSVASLHSRQVNMASVFIGQWTDVQSSWSLLHWPHPLELSGLLLCLLPVCSATLRGCLPPVKSPPVSLQWSVLLSPSSEVSSCLPPVKSPPVSLQSSLLLSPSSQVSSCLPPVKSPPVSLQWSFLLSPSSEVSSCLPPVKSPPVSLQSSLLLSPSSEVSSCLPPVKSPPVSLQSNLLLSPSSQVSSCLPPVKSPCVFLQSSLLQSSLLIQSFCPAVMAAVDSGGITIPCNTAICLVKWVTVKLNKFIL